MFPIPFNFPFRKNDGAITTIGDAISSGGGGGYVLPTASASVKGGVKVGAGLTMDGEVLKNTNPTPPTPELPTYSSALAGKVLTVGDDGSLEWDEKGSGGGNELAKWDFTKYGTRDITDASLDSGGLHLTGSDSRLGLGNIYRDTSIFIDVVESNAIAESGNNYRLAMIAYENGLVYRGSVGKWSFYNGSWATESDISDINFFDDSTIKIYFDNSGHWNIYKNGVFVYKPNITVNDGAPFIIGSSGSSFKDIVISSVRVYSGNYTE